MTDYKCGHSHDIIVTDSNPLTILAYLEWKDTVGIDGDRSLCWDCFTKTVEAKESEHL